MPLARLFAIWGTLLLTWPGAAATNSATRHAAAWSSPRLQTARLSPAALQVAHIRDQWAQFLNAKQLGPFMTLYAPDAVFLQPTGERINGVLSIRALTQKTWNTFTPNITMHGVTTKVSCDMAYDEGDFHETLTSISSGAKQQTQGAYLMVFKRDNHGRWLIVEQVWTGLEPKRD
jgi:ketosteroid isomerase-like protein